MRVKKNLQGAETKTNKLESPAPFSSPRPPRPMESPHTERERDEDQEGRRNQGMVNHDRIARTNKEISLPLDIIIDILSRTPGSSLVTFRTVCKLWRSLTYDNRLIELHLDRATRVNPPRLIIFSQDEEKGQQKYHFILLDEAMNTKYRLTRASDAVLTTPPCNGLICLYDYHRNIKLCNPTTKEFLPLPKPTVDSRRVVNGFPKCSFGFHPKTKEYKVVRFFYLQMNHSTKTYDLGCEVFTLGSYSWRYIGNIHYYVTGSGINVNGSIYWTTGVTAQIPDEIIALDLKDEKFRVVSLPDIASYEIEVNGAMFLVQLEGNLCLVNAPFGAPGPMDIWMLKDYTNNVWIHRCRVPLMYNLGDCRWRPEPIIIYQGKILLKWGGYLYYHDLQGNQETVEKVYNDKFLGNTARFYAFVESLVPLENFRRF